MCNITGVEERLHKVLRADWIKTQVSIATLTYNGENNVSTFSVVFNQLFFKLAGNGDRHKISEEFEFRPDRTTPYAVHC